MRESYREDLASRSGLDPYAGEGNLVGVASARGSAGQPLSSEITTSVCRSCFDLEKATSTAARLASCGRTRRSLRPCACADIPSARTGRSHEFPRCFGTLERSENASGGTAGMHAHGKSDGPIVPAKRMNKTGTPAAESVEERGSPKGNAASHVLAPDTVPGYARHHRARLRLVEILYLDRCTRGRNRMG